MNKINYLLFLSVTVIFAPNGSTQTDRIAPVGALKEKVKECVMSIGALKRLSDEIGYDTTLDTERGNYPPSFRIAWQGRRVSEWEPTTFSLEYQKEDCFFGSLSAFYKGFQRDELCKVTMKQQMIISSSYPAYTETRVKIVKLEGDVRYFRRFLKALACDVELSMFVATYVLKFPERKDNERWGRVAAVNMGKFEKEFSAVPRLDMKKEYPKWIKKSEEELKKGNRYCRQ
ncbi:MAG: hypothetical protein ACJAZS_000627 [Alteromonas naphthalenivorans]|jgi:hypothetical protein